MNKIIEIDGPPVRYFEFLENGHNCKIEYKTLAIGGDNPNALLRYGENTLEMIRTELNKLEKSILYWRRRPTIEQDAESQIFRWICRLETWPKLPESFWSKLCVKELGEKPEVLKNESGNE